MRALTFILLLLLTVLEIGPIPIAGLLLLWVVLFRPLWFYNLVLDIYKDVIPGREIDNAQPPSSSR
ncbi:MAG: hypothetical protein EPN21_06430 [Methylococcaceae bacterium]|nr:MAG: hypothetical protein EPN21_06430 [Methylococcaceae bacterium]